MSIEKFAGYKTEVKENMQICEMSALRNKVKEEEHLHMNGGVKRTEHVFAPPTGLRENAETAISGRGPGLARRKVYQ